MGASEYWKLCEHLSVIQAALLILNREPGTYQEFVENNFFSDKPDGYDAVSTALKNSVLQKSLTAVITFRKQWKYNGRIDIREEMIDDTSNPDWQKTTVKVDDLKSWLVNLGVNSGFFFPDADDSPAYLDKSNPSYAPKLAAAVRAWTIVANDSSRLSGKTPKKALEIWLRQHANEYGLTKEDGNPNETGIEEVCKVANWKPEGGATRTPGNENPATPENRRKNKM